jgi:hypothetical protein
LQPNLNRLWNELRSHFGSSVAALLLPPRNREGGEINPLGYPSMSRSKTETSRLFVPIERQPAGGTDAPDLVGNAFLKRWTDRSVGSLFTFVESQMPVGRRPHLICRRGPSLKETGDFKINNSGRCDEGVLARGESFHRMPYRILFADPWESPRFTHNGNRSSCRTRRPPALPSRLSLARS